MANLNPPPYAEVVVNRPIIQKRRLDPDAGSNLDSADSGSHFEWSEHQDTRTKTFHYRIPRALLGQLRPGHLISVPFRSQQLQGIVIAVSDDLPIPESKLRPITDLLDPEPILSPEQLALAQWIAREYLAPLATCVNYFLPPGANRQPQTIVELLEKDAGVDLPNLTPLERALEIYLKSQKKPVKLEDLEASTVEGLLKKGLARKRSILSPPRVGPKIEKTAQLLIDPEDIEAALFTLGRHSKQADILRCLADSDDPLPKLETILAETNCATEGPLQALLERGWVEYHPEQTLLLLPPPRHSQEIPEAPLTNLEQVILDHLTQVGRPCPLETIDADIVEMTDAQTLVDVGTAVESLLAAGHITTLAEPARLSLKLSRVKLMDAVIQLRGVGQYAEILSLLADEPDPVWVGWIYTQTNANQRYLQILAQAGLIEFEQSRYWRDPLEDRIFTIDTAPPLTESQHDVMSALLAALQAKEDAEGTETTAEKTYRPFLLHGVTGSGKTEIYLQTIKEILAQNQGVIFLVPEIMLATQIVQRVQARFPKKVALWHSSLSPGERFDTWERVRSGDFPIVVGPRSALFAPLHNLGLIIVDEEHEPAYKQQTQPTMHARDVAIELARINQIPVILGSATPDIVSYRKAQRGEYRLLTLPNRILAHKQHLAVQAAILKQTRRPYRFQPQMPVPRQDNSGGKAANPVEAIETQTSPDLSPDIVSLPLPPVKVVDMREELKAGNRSIFSQALHTAISETLAAGEQVILFLNRRGTATFVNCRDCGYVAICPSCDNTLTYHAPSERLVCHYCGYHTYSPETCPNCYSSHIRFFGLGTERVEAMLRRSFPQAKPLRFDRDTTGKAGSHYTLLQNFMDGKANVMVGTQMVAKGLDLPLVTLVGVISADTALYLPDFRAAERTFQILMQVAGRAGRSPLGGQVIIQTYTPDQPAIVAASDHDYHTFVQDELRFRYEQGYPPFKRLARLQYSGYGDARAQHIAADMAERLRLWVAQQGFPSVDIVGPAPAYVQRVRSQYRWQILIRAPDPAPILRPVPLPLGWRVDIDPVSLL